MKMSRLLNTRKRAERRERLSHASQSSHKRLIYDLIIYEAQFVRNKKPFCVLHDFNETRRYKMKFQNANFYQRPLKPKVAAFKSASNSQQSEKKVLKLER